MSFERTIEDFTCERCGKQVKGNGYTNHCPVCLTSKRVDVDPGDRKSECGGLMPAIGYEKKDGDWRVIQRCERCGHTRANKLQPDDDREALTALGK